MSKVGSRGRHPKCRPKILLYTQNMKLGNDAIFFTMRAKITDIKHSGYSIVVAKDEKIDSFSVRRDHKSCKYM